jgi:hypothetical protein
MRCSAALPVLAAGAAIFATAGAALADTTTIDGAFTSTACGEAHTFSVAGPADVEVALQLSDSRAPVIAEVHTPKDLVLRVHGTPITEPFRVNVADAGSYVLRICPDQRARNGSTVTYSGTIMTTPTSIGAVAGVSATLRRSASGWGAIKTRDGLAWFWVRASNRGSIRLHFDDSARNLHVKAVANLTASFGPSSVKIRGLALTIVLVDNGARDTVTFEAPGYRASGTVVRGGVRLV